MSKVYTGNYVNFQDRAREAMEYYHAALGGNLDLQTVNEQGVAGPAGPEDPITHARLEADGVLILATDGHPNYPAQVGENIAIARGGTDKDRLTSIFNQLAEGGRVKMPLTEQAAGAVGWLTDRFGINWMVTIDRA